MSSDEVGDRVRSRMRLDTHHLHSVSQERVLQLNSTVRSVRFPYICCYDLAQELSNGHRLLPFSVVNEDCTVLGVTSRLHVDYILSARCTPPHSCLTLPLTPCPRAECEDSVHKQDQIS